MLIISDFSLHLFRMGDFRARILTVFRWNITVFAKYLILKNFFNLQIAMLLLQLIVVAG